MRRFCVGGVSGGAPFAAAVAACLAAARACGRHSSARSGRLPMPGWDRRCLWRIGSISPSCPAIRALIAVAFRGFHWSVGARRGWQRTSSPCARRASTSELIAQPEISERILGSFREGLQRGYDGSADRSVDLLAALGDRSCIASRRRRACGSAARTVTFRSQPSRAGRSEFPIASSPSCRRKVTCGWSLTTPTCRSGCTPLHAPAPVRRIERRNAKGASPCQRLDNT